MNGVSSTEGVRMFTRLCIRRLMLWLFVHVTLLSIFLYASSVFGGSGHRDFLCTVLIFASFFLLNVAWFFDMAINVDLKVWMRTAMDLILFPTLIAATCSCAAVMLGIFMDYRYPAHELAVSSANLICCALMHTMVINDRYKRGGLADVVIASPFEDASARKLRTKKTDNAELVWGGEEDDNDDKGNTLGWIWAYVRMVLRNEILGSLRHAVWIALVTIACITACRHAVTGILCHPGIPFLDYLFCPDYTSYNYLSMVYQIFLASVMLQVFPLLMLSSLKILLLSPITFITTPIPAHGSIESTASLRNSQSNYAPVSNQTYTRALTSGMSFGMEPLRKVVKFSCVHGNFRANDTSNYRNGGGQGLQGDVVNAARNGDSSLALGGAMGSEKGLSTPRWQEALFTYRAISEELLAGLRVSYLGPPLVTYLKGGGGGYIFGNQLGNVSGTARFQTLTRSLAMSDFARVACAETPGLGMRRRQLFLEGWGEACVAALTYVSAVTLQIQLITCHAMETVIKPQPHWSSFHGEGDRSQTRKSTSSSGGSSGRDRRDSNGGGESFRFNQILGGNFQAKNLDRLVSIPEAVVELVRRGKSRVDKSIFGFLGNAMMNNRLLGWSWPVIRLVLARYPFTGAVPPLVLQTCINAVRGVSYGLVKSLTDDPTGMAHYHLIGSVEILIRLELALEEFEVCMARCQVNILAQLRKIKKVDAKSLQIEVGDAIDRLVGAYKDVLSRPSCPLLQDDIVGPVLVARIKTMR